ncbi:helix-turn-helix domain-containing protein [Micrococcus luteus]|uniref:helix-turn-helix domain-containing protein n=1 Tax=Micrococcus luteus TaxID=1270 RepID=UPI000E03104A|nr:helix-turn-helix domain-containing protein [Micrococcus luteus]STY68803.1 DNA binding domain, excisionase family [Micrococcus luteus]
MTIQTAPVPASADAQPEPVLRVPEVAEHLHCTPQLVYSLIHRGELRAVRLGRLIRVPLSALNEYLATAA